MELHDFKQGSMWAITPAVLSTMLEELQASGATAKLPAKNSSADVKKTGKVAVIPVVGPLSKRRTVLSMLFGGTGMDEIGALIAKAIADSEVDAIVLDIDSPGGTVAGCSDLADLVFAARSAKPIVSYSDGAMCSAAYWIGSAAHRVISGKAACIGSIGCLMIHTDRSGLDEKLGIKTTLIASGKNKTLGNEFSPLSDEDRLALQEKVDYTQQVFISAVSKNLGVEESVIKHRAGNGDTFMGEQAVRAGLAHQTGSFVDALRIAASMATEAAIVENHTAQKRHLVPAKGGGAATGVSFDGVGTDGIAMLIELEHGPEIAGRFKAFSDLGGRPDVFLSLLKVEGVINNKPGRVEDCDRILAGLRRDADNNISPDKFNALVGEYQQSLNCGKARAIEEVMRRHPAEHEAYLRYVNRS